MRHTTKIFCPVHLFFLGLLVLVGGVGVRAQTPDNKKTPLMSSYKGVMIGMAAGDVRLKLGEPATKSDEQDFYVIGEMESVQVFYNAEHKATTISVMYMGEKAPACKDVFGEEATPKADGSVYKKAEYKEAGYAVIYSHSASATAITTVTFQKL